MRYFEVVGSPHYGAKEGEKWVKGDVVESESDLNILFPNKFREVSGPRKKRNSPTELPPPSEESVLPTPTPSPVEEKLVPAAESVVTEGSGKEDAPESLGEDITAEYPKAGEAGFLVFKDGSLYFVTEADMPLKAINEKPLKKKEVEAFIEKQSS